MIGGNQSSIHNSKIAAFLELIKLLGFAGIAFQSLTANPPKPHAKNQIMKGVS